MSSGQAAIFLDRDGVVIEDHGLLVDSADIRIPEAVPCALRELKASGFQLIVVTNQAIVARGLLSERDLSALHDEIQRRLTAAGGPLLDHVYYCPHHPEATLDAYRLVCECRKPRPGMLLRAAAEHNIALRSSFMIGDRLTDIAAGAAAGCRTVLLQTGRHEDPPIVTAGEWNTACQPDYVATDMSAATTWILDACEPPTS